MASFLLGLVETYGYIIVFLGVGIESLGVPLPGETALVIGAVVASQGHLAPWGVAAAGFAGAVIGDNIGYWVGRTYGRRLLTKQWVQRFYSPERLGRAELLFERRGWVAVFFGRFVALLRIFAGPLAGLHRMRWPQFVAANALGAAIWVASITVVGLLVGSNLDHAVKLVARAGYVGLGVAGLVGAIAVWQWRRRRAHGDEGS